MKLSDGLLRVTILVSHVTNGAVYTLARGRRPARGASARTQRLAFGEPRDSQGADPPTAGPARSPSSTGRRHCRTRQPCRRERPAPLTP